MATPSQGPAHFKKVPYGSIEEHRWSSAEWPAESPPSTREDGPPGLEQTDGRMSGTATNASISDNAALPAGSTSPIAWDQGPRRSGR